MNNKIKLEAVSVCINYSDFLKYTLPFNKNFFDKYVVVTSSEDKKTQDLCHKHNVKCVTIKKTHLIELDSKGLAINKGLEVLDKDAWVLHLDADIWLPPLTRTILDNFSLQTDCIYGTDRFMCESFEDWLDFLNKEQYKNIHYEWVFLDTAKFKIGSRMIQYYGEGYWPIGFFQLWHPKGSGVYTYPNSKIGYDRDDVLHMKQWNKGKRLFIPDFIPIHLSSQLHEKGQNWEGRSTKQFGPDNHEYNYSDVKNYTLGKEIPNGY
jgi:hypothetical protein